MGKHTLMNARVIILAAALLGGCQSAPVCEPVVQIKEVSVPVETARTPPPELVQCDKMPASWAPLRFSDPGKGAAPGITSGLTKEQEESLRQFVKVKLDCIHAWKVWAIPGYK